jgi:hypothetical protein
MWLARNDARDLPMIEDPDRLARRIVLLTKEWFSLKEPGPGRANQSEEHWLPPEEGWVKVNSDGAFLKEGGHGRGGVILRDHHGGFIAGSSHFFPLVADPERAKLLACKHAVLLAREQGVTKLVMELDCLGAVGKLSNPELDRSIHGPLVEDIKASLRELDCFQVKHVSRVCNGAAHKLAKLGCFSKCFARWVDTPPECISELVDSEFVV